VKQVLVLAAIGAYLVSSVFPSVFIFWLISILCIVIIANYFLSVKRFVQILGSVFLGLGAVMLIQGDVAWQNYFLSFGGMLNLLSLFALLPLIAIPIELGQYAIGVQNMIQKRVNSSGFLYMITSFLSFVLSSFMNLATLPMMYHSIRPSINLFPIKEKERFMSRAITHGFSMPLIWTPVAPIVGIIIEMTGVSWNSILPILIPISLAGLALDWFMGVRTATKRKNEEGFPTPDEWTKSRTEVAVSMEASNQQVKGSNLIHIVAAILLFNGLVTVIEMNTTYGFLFLVTMIVIPFSLLWSLFLGKGRDFIAKSRQTLPAHLIKMREQFFIFLCAGFFISAIQVSGASDVISMYIIDFKNMIGAAFFILLIPLFPLGLAFTGLHPAVGLALLAESVDPKLLGISSEIVAIAMLTGAATAFLMGPYNATIGIMSAIVKESPYRVSNWNAPFTLAYLAMIMVVLIVLLLL
jgi:hypothetical protein